MSLPPVKQNHIANCQIVYIIFGEKENEQVKIKG